MEVAVSHIDIAGYQRLQKQSEYAVLIAFPLQ
jgi:hypothetical protein